jgi:hypothetical protein
MNMQCHLKNKGPRNKIKMKRVMQMELIILITTAAILLRIRKKITLKEAASKSISGVTSHQHVYDPSNPCI